MRKLIMMITTAVVFTACSTESELETKKDVIVTDTTGMYNSNAATDTGAVLTNEQPVTPEPRVITRTQTRTVYVDRTPKPSTKKTTTQSQQQTQANNTGADNSGSANSGSGTDASTTGTTQPAEKEKGMSNSTKGAVIGGVGGAVTGAILSKKKGKGAIIGGVIGAAGGYILGRKKDKAQDTAR